MRVQYCGRKLHTHNAEKQGGEGATPFYPPLLVVRVLGNPCQKKNSESPHGLGR